MFEDEKNGVAEQEIAEPVTESEEIDTEQQDADAAEPFVGDEPNENAIPDKVWETSRKRAEREAEQKYSAKLVAEKTERERAEQERDRLVVSLKGRVPGENAQEIADALEAEARQTTPERIRAEREAVDGRISKMESRHMADLMEIEDLHQVQRINPSVKSISELGNEFVAIRFARDGLGRLVHTAESAYLELQKQKTPPKQRPNGEDKAHLIPTGGGVVAGSPADIPQSELEFYKDSFPKDTPAQLRERYNRILKRQGE